MEVENSINKQNKTKGIYPGSMDEHTSTGHSEDYNNYQKMDQEKEIDVVKLEQKNLIFLVVLIILKVFHYLMMHLIKMQVFVIYEYLKVFLIMQVLIHHEYHKAIMVFLLLI